MPKVVLGISVSFCANFLKGQVDFFVKKGWDVIIISAAGEEISMLAKKENARLCTVNFRRSISPFADVVCLWQIIQIIRKEKPDIVNAGNPKSGFLIMCACWLLRFRHRIFTMHGLVADSRSGISKFIIRMTERISCSIAKKVIVVSPSLQAHAIEEKIVNADKTIVIEKGSCNGVNMQAFVKDAVAINEAQKLSAELKLSRGELVIGFVGRLSKDKGIDLLFEAFNLVKAKHRNIRLLLAGPLEKENPFSKKHFHQLYHDEQISYIGKVYDVVPVYALMDILVLSSFREGFGNVLIEAASMEVPVIAPDIPGCRNALQPGYNGLLFKKGSMEELAAAIEKLLINKNLRYQYGHNGRQFTEQNFSQEKIWNGLLKIYGDMLAADRHS